MPTTLPQWLAVLIAIAPCAALAQPSDGEETLDEAAPEFGPDEGKSDEVESPPPAPKPKPAPSASASVPAATASEVADPGEVGETRVVRRRSAASDSAIATPGQALASEERFDLSVFGYIRFLGVIVQDDPGVSFVGRNDGYRLQNARIGIEGRFRDKVYLRLSADGADDERSGPNDVEGTLRFAIKDAFADVKLADALELRVGRYPVIFDLERFTSALQRGFISRSLESRGVAATEGFESPGLGVSRNMGLAIRSPSAYASDSLSIGYELAAQNGNGSLAAQNDNDSLAYSGSVITNIGKTLMIFGSVRYNERTEGELPFRRTERDLGTAFGVWFENSMFRAAGQLIFRRTTFPTTGAPVENAWGGHAELIVAIPGASGLKAGYRFSLLDESDRIPQNSVQEHTAGLSLDLPSYHANFKLNAVLPVEEAGRELDNARGEMLVEVQL